MRILAIVALVAVAVVFVAGCASTMSASGGGGRAGGRSALLEEMQGRDTVVIDKFGRTIDSNDWINEAWMFRFKRIPR